MKRMLEAAPDSHIPQMLGQQQACQDQSGGQAYPTDPLMDTSAKASKQCKEHESAAANASSPVVLVSGAGHDALAMAELTQVRCTGFACMSNHK